MIKNNLIVSKVVGLVKAEILCNILYIQRDSDTSIKYHVNFLKLFVLLYDYLVGDENPAV